VRLGGRGLHSSTFQLNLSCFCPKMHPKHPRIPPSNPEIPPTQPQMHLLFLRKR
jgi:hypothetical protein